MTIPYGQNGDPSVVGEKFTNSQFLVFMNRISAFVVSGIIIMIKDQPRHMAPCYKYSFSSFSNIMSSWFQYEALKFVSFPTQVIAKSTKVIPGIWIPATRGIICLENFITILLLTLVCLHLSLSHAYGKMRIGEKISVLRILHCCDDQRGCGHFLA